ncbi:1-deoxy-D-xylulose 5-phosphate synthase [hydrothermal vent metagenome]|uniref:1-deoxy-D-xylulose-5-phosphate synthase n=1 Tax=hydrothermal vent metagenome TaxID=652676 RepID=A0A3B0X523_9ZZZZ
MTEATPTFALLQTINSPADVRALNENQLTVLASELREFIIQSVAQTGGHLSAGLGTVELTLALHSVYNTPVDRLIWDVGHQSYPHKIITGRRDRMNSIRQHGGLSGFPKRSESPYDTFGVGHSSTSISAALGMSLAASLQGKEQKTVAIIGDGAMTAGMAFEALNHGGDTDADVLVILNDNDMSISKNVGALSRRLSKILSGKMYSTMRSGSQRVLEKISMWDLAQRTEEHVKGMVMPGTLFEELGFHYYGPVDGHDIPTLITMLKNLRAQKGPRLLHIVTQKGKGYRPAEENPCLYHGLGSFDPETGDKLDKSSGKPTYTEIFSNWVCEMAEQDEKLVAITPAMCEGSGLVDFSQRFADRYHDVGIAEQHAVTLAAGMACEGIKPVVAIYSTFLQRAYDQLIHDVAIQNLPVLFAIDRAGLVGADGPTHAGNLDLSYLRCVPNMLIMTPADENECRQMLTTGFHHSGPAAVRYPRGQGPGTPVDKTLTPIPVGQALLSRQGDKIALLAFGSMLGEALIAAEKINATVVNMRFVKPLDAQMLRSVCATHELLVTIEENVIAGGAGSGVNEWLQASQINLPVINLGLPDHFVEHGSTRELLSDCGLDANGILSAISRQMKNV